MNNAIEIRPGIPADWPAVKRLLSEAGLPVADLDAQSLVRFLVAIDGSTTAATVVGAVALEVYGELALLRSLVVATSARSAGCGSRLVEAIEQRAGESGVNELWLLTIDADRFFSSRGYRAVTRDAAPGAIRATAEFSSLCPGSAVLMVHSLT